MNNIYYWKRGKPDYKDNAFTIHLVPINFKPRYYYELIDRSQCSLLCYLYTNSIEIIKYRWYDMMQLFNFYNSKLINFPNGVDSMEDRISYVKQTIENAHREYKIVNDNQVNFL